MSGFPADELLTVTDVELVHSSVYEQSRSNGWPMSDWTDDWAEAWSERLDACRSYIAYSGPCAPAEVAALVWVYGAMLQLPGHDGHKRIATGSMEAQVVRFGYVLKTQGLELSDMAYNIVDRCERGGDRERMINEASFWIDDRMT